MKSRRATPRPLLSDLEHDVMHAVWQAGPATVEAVLVTQKRTNLEYGIRRDEHGHLAVAFLHVGNPICVTVPKRVDELLQFLYHPLSAFLSQTERHRSLS